MYLGQYRQGDEVVEHHRAYAAVPSTTVVPFALGNPRIRTFQTGATKTLIESTREMAAYDSPTLPGFFRLPIQLDERYSATGSYTVEIRWNVDVAGNPEAVVFHCFEVLPGGSPDGVITSMLELVRPDKRFIMCGTTAGRILRRKNPRVAK